MTGTGGASPASSPASPEGRPPEETARALARLLARRLRDPDAGSRAGGGEDGMDGVDGAVTVAELRRTLLPYPRCREALGLASKAEYDVGLLTLLAEDALLRPEEDGLREAVDRELASPEPGLGVLDDWAASSLRTGPGFPPPPAGSRPEGSHPGESRPEGSGGETPSGPERGGAADGAGAADHAGEAGAAGRADVTREAARPSEGCRSCGHELPDREGVRYCPHCGADQRTPRCPDCGEPQERGWRYCPFCGSENDA